MTKNCTDVFEVTKVTLVIAAKPFNCITFRSLSLMYLFGGISFFNLDDFCQQTPFIKT